jgi:citronellol/citronellal dehydrogenase
MKRFDLMNQINARGTFMVTKYCLPYLIQAKNPHILVMAPPIDTDVKWFKRSLGYSIAKIGMSMCVVGMAE